MIKALQKKLIKKQAEKQIMIATAVTLSCVAFLVVYHLLNRMCEITEEDGDESGCVFDEDIGVFGNTGAQEDTGVPDVAVVPEDTGRSENANASAGAVMSENPGISEDTLISEETEVY